LSLDSSGTAKDLSECYAIIPSIRFIKPYPNDAEATVRDVEIKFNEILKDTGKSLEALPEEFVGTWRERGCVCDKNIGGEFRIMYKDGKIIFGRTDIGRARGRYGGYDGLDMLTGIGQASSFKEMESGVSFLVDDLTTTEKEKKPYYVNRLPKKDDWDMTEWIGEKEKVGFQRAMIPLEGREGYRVEDFKN
jgi:hypothetical protein